MRDFIDKNVNAGYNDQMRAADAIPNINLSLPKQHPIKDKISPDTVRLKMN